MYQVPKLPYEYNALAPVISEEIMRLHHDKHHQAYVDKLNKTLESLPTEQSQQSLETLLENIDSLPDAARKSIRNNGGGHYNHSLFWQWLTPEAGQAPSAELEAAIVRKWGSFDDFKKEFSIQAGALFGSGWVWLLPDMEIVSTSNQDNPLISNGIAPILGLDVWEHAYYLDYKNERPRYIENWWNIVNWSVVSAQFSRSMK